MDPGFEYSNIKGMIRSRGGWILYVTFSHGGYFRSAYLDFWISIKPPKTTKIDPQKN